MNPITYFKNYPEPFYEDWRSEPIPGWGARPVMAGPKMVGVGKTEDRQYEGEPSSLSTRAKALIVVGLIGAAAVGIVFSDELFGKREG